MPEKQPNILFIVTDQMRADCVGACGGPARTPYLDTLARQGVCFDNAYSATPSCIPARAALYTGMSQRAHGRVGYRDGVDWNYPHMLAGEFAAAGYHTQCVGKLHVHPARSLCGFHNVELHDGYMHFVRAHSNRELEGGAACDDYLCWLRDQIGARADLTDSGLECNSWAARPWPYAEQVHPTNWVAERSMDFLRRRDPRKPFFLMASFVRPHAPLDPPAPYWDMYAGRTFGPPPVGGWAADAPEMQRYDSYCGQLAPDDLDRARAAYYALITHMDHQIGRMLQGLFEYGVLENTLIFFVSDHGDQMGDHWMFRKNAPYQGSVHIPLIAYDPGGRIGLTGGRRVGELCELRDVMPTLLDAAGLPIPETVEGRSTLPLMRGESCPWRSFIHGEHSLGERSFHFIVTRDAKYVWYSQTGREQLFDLSDDPQELHDLSARADRAPQLEEMRRTLIHALEGREEGYTDGERLVVGRPPRDCLKTVFA